MRVPSGGSPNTHSVPGNPNRRPLAAGGGGNHAQPLCLSPVSWAHPEDVRNSWESGQAWGAESESTQPTATSPAPGQPPSALSQGRGLQWRNDGTFYLGQEGLFKTCTRQLLIHSRKWPNVPVSTQGREGKLTGWVHRASVGNREAVPHDSSRSGPEPRASLEHVQLHHQTRCVPRWAARPTSPLIASTCACLKSNVPSCRVPIRFFSKEAALST